MTELLVCPHCKNAVAAADVHCKHCNFNLRDVKAAEKTLVMPHETQDVIQAPARRAYFPKNAYLHLAFEQKEKSINIYFDKENHAIMGRGLVTDTDVMRIDLAPYGAVQYGVSRRHVRIIRMPATVIVEDLGTLNGTFINGERLSSSHRYVLCEGDTLKMGGLAVKVSFEIKEAITEKQE